MYVFRGDEKVSRGKKGMRAKERITLYVATNMTGSRKVPLSVIGTSKTPRCFRLSRGGKPPLTYFNQKKAWSDGPTYQLWFFDVFLPHVRRYHGGKKVVLIMDNCGPHGQEVVDPRGQITTAFLPPNCTSVHQPMDAGIIACVKKKYRYTLLEKMLEVFARQDECREIAKTKKRTGLAGIGDGVQANVLDAMIILKTVWKDVEESTIARCWAKTGLLSARSQAEFANTHGKISSSDAELSDKVDELVETVAALDLSEKTETAINEDVQDMMMGVAEVQPNLRDALEGWSNLESQPEIQEELEREVYAEMDEAVTVEGVLLQEEEEQNEECNDATNSKENDFPPEEGNLFLQHEHHLKQLLSGIIDIEKDPVLQRFCPETTEFLKQARDSFFRSTRKAKKKEPRKTVQSNLSFA